MLLTQVLQIALDRIHIEFKSRIVGNSIQDTERALFVRSVGRALSRDHGR